MTGHDQPRKSPRTAISTGAQAGQRFYDAVLRSGFSMEPTWPSPIAKHTMSDWIAFNRLKHDAPVQVDASLVTSRRDGPIEEGCCQDETSSDTTCTKPADGSDRYGYARAA